jgi:hypothetical protein
MTCIVGVIDKKNKCVWMGSDSLCSNEYSKSVQSQTKCFKSKEREDTVLGGTTTFRHLDLLRYSTSLFPEVDKYRDIEINHEYIVTKFIPNVHKLFEEGFIEETKDGAKEGGNFLIGIKNQLYEIQDDYSVLEYKDGFSSVGCGEGYAKASLFTTEGTNMEIKDRIIKALESAEKFSIGVQRPFIIINTMNNEVITVE